MMNIIKTNWYFIALSIVVFGLISANELGYGAITLLPGLLLAYWLMTKAFTQTP